MQPCLPDQLDKHRTHGLLAGQLFHRPLRHQHTLTRVLVVRPRRRQSRRTCMCWPRPAPACGGSWRRARLSRPGRRRDGWGIWGCTSMRLITVRRIAVVRVVIRVCCIAGVRAGMCRSWRVRTTSSACRPPTKDCMQQRVTKNKTYVRCFFMSATLLGL